MEGRERGGKGCRILSRAKSGVKILNPSAVLYPVVGTYAETRPVRLRLRKGVQYEWCSCGLSGKQPWCDGSHKAEGVTTLRPVLFEVEADGEYSMCLCKATRKRPFCDGQCRPWCDGSHKAEGVTTLRPVLFEVEADGEYSMCLCKATRKRPFCDGQCRLQVWKRRYEGQPQYCAYAKSPVYEGVAEKLGYNPKHGRWHF
ncbi:unnamed protein product [Gongylonema pulchrum]|uniref:CDGSH iron-sulfur domain-containing protein 3, mitochondrial n=1 Tax=Gongylonema pulchrum TaxID=637853 RepID=A0A183E4C0_9BILA|nr:unnamed protein product [Gongylonema pulchrum]